MARARATDAVEKLLALVRVKATVLRQGESQEIPHEDVVPGDIVLLTAGGNIPGDSLGKESDRVRLYAYLNAASESGYMNAIV